MATAISDIPVHKPRAFVVDDSQIARYILSCELERLGYQVEVADTAESALRQIGEPYPDVIFMDHLLPGIDGLEAISRLRGRRDTAHVPIIMYTSQDGHDFAQRARAVGADDIYVKTAEESQLNKILARLNLLPARAAAANAAGKVTPIRRQATPSRERGASISREQLARLLEPSLETHHARLHQELLGEFAILERHEERMRRDLFARVEMLARKSNMRVEAVFAAERKDRRRDVRRLARWSFAVAATMLLSMGVLTRVAWVTMTDASELQQLTSSAAQAVQDNTQAVMAMQQAMDARQVTASTAVQSATYVPEAAEELGTYSHGAAELLVAELQSMGILGPVLVETSAGSFCIEVTPAGMQFATNGAALTDCAPLPVQLSAASYSQ
jgi:CheY-like chemotaxis protein